MKIRRSFFALLGILFFASCNKSGVALGLLQKSAGVEQATDQKVQLLLPETVSFNEHIQPIFAETCYHCHGPDSGTREPKKEPLRLDAAEFAFAKRENGKPAIVAGDPAASLMIQLIHETDPELRMPPPEAHKDLKPEQIALLEKWVLQGAKYEPHWSFIPPQRPTVPAVADAAWGKNPIDAFILEKLEKNQFKPNPVENPRRLLRRMNFDLTGLPPSPEDLDAFEKDFALDPDKAIDATADRLLSSTASAEHFTKQWLDAARYADTHGIHIDNYRSIWPYRDWVINAFKSNMRWDQFTIEQMGGDILPNATLDQKVATGFNRCLPTTGEGGAIPEEYDAIYAADRVTTTSAIWLGLSTQCAQCHDHKFDPVNQKDFYQLSAFFRNTPMSALDGNNGQHPPNIFATTFADRSRVEQLDKELADYEKNVVDRAKNARPDFEKWLASQPAAAADAPDPSLVVQLPLNEAEGPIRGTLLGKPYENPAAVQRRDGPGGKALLVNTQVISVGDVANFKRTDSFSYATFIYVEGAPAGAVFARMNEKENYRGWDFWLEAGKPAVHVIDAWQDKATKIVANDALTPGQWHHVAVTFDGGKPSDQVLTLYVDGKPAASTPTVKAVGDNIQTSVPFTIGARSGGTNIQGATALQDLRIYNKLLSAADVAALASRTPITNLLAVPAEKRTLEQTEALYQTYLNSFDPVLKSAKEKQTAALAEKEKLKGNGAVTLIMEEKPNLEPFAHMLVRGSYMDKGEKVGVGVPKALPQMTDSMPKNRLGLGQWLVSKTNPLPARVTVNRLWGYIFGTGIVETVEDFGVMGARPTHPKLLDWLAVEFMDSGWDYRHMAKLMVTSATYRQSAVASPDKMERDPLNRLLARAPRFRLEAEPLRDSILLQSKLLVNKVGGPSVKPYQPEGIWEAVAMNESNTKNYVQDKGENLYRRSMYTIWKRTAPNPSMEILNAPSREVFCVRRERTNTPLQAFVTLNDPQFVEAFRQLAANTISIGSDGNARFNSISQLLLGRALTADEIKTFEALRQDAETFYRKNEAEAVKVISVGESKSDPKLAPAELATWTLVASSIFNLDEALTK